MGAQAQILEETKEVIVEEVEEQEVVTIETIKQDIAELLVKLEAIEDALESL